MKGKSWMILVALGIAISFVACSSPSGVEFTIEPPGAPPHTLPACTEDEEITLDVHSMKSGEVQVQEVQGQGFVSKESLTLIFIAEREVAGGTGKTIIQTSRPYAVNAEGSFSEQDPFLSLNADESPEWELRVVHQRGVACTTFIVQ